ncbi:MAG: endonuclease MutS2, partial [Bacteroidota bacterium]
MKLSIDEQHHFPLATYPNVSEELRMLEIPGFVLSEQQLFLLSRSIRVIYRIYQFFKADKQELYPTLYDIIRETVFDDYLLGKIDHIIDEEGNIKPNASPELMRIRRLQNSKRKELDKVFRSLINNFKSKGLLKDNEESFRNGRRVLAVPAEHKRQIKGIIHDESATGKTAFVEPEAIIHINNDIFDLEREEKREIYRILRDVSEQLSAYVPVLNTYQGIIGRYDIINAKSRLAKTMNGQAPKLVDTPHFAIKNALHPLLYLKNKKADKKTIPFDLAFLNNNRILVLSGPNAGGKSISLKAVGLLQLMVQCGMLVPIDPKSEMGLFEKIFIDMGDQQSLEDELSTYSSRLKNMKDFLDEANKKTLILIDEFGSGTDPKIGGSIAEAVLQAFHKRKVFGF